jgi:hypothetical protein
MWLIIYGWSHQSWVKEGQSDHGQQPKQHVEIWSPLSTAMHHIQLIQTFMAV